MMTEGQMNPENVVGGQEKPVAAKKEASWLRTILWMLSMMLLVNVVVGIVAYFLFFYNK